jgi:hypothetical protein
MYGVASFVRGRWRADISDWDREGRVYVIRRAGWPSSMSMQSKEPPRPATTTKAPLPVIGTI